MAEKVSEKFEIVLSCLTAKAQYKTIKIIEKGLLNYDHAENKVLDLNESLGFVGHCFGVKPGDKFYQFR